MRLKSFHAKSMTEAMRQAQDELGEDALIVATREEPGGWFKVTAAVEQAEVSPAPARKALTPKNTAPRRNSDDILETITDAMLHHRVPGQVSEKIITAAMTFAEKDPHKALARALEKIFSFEKRKNTRSTKPVMLVGPPGAGKTLMAAKMAARAVLDGDGACVITTDIARAGGIEQLSSFLRILDLPLLTAETPKDLKAALGKATPHTSVIIDTGGLNPFDPGEMKTLAQLMNVADMEPALVLPAGLDAEEASEMAMTFELLGVQRLIPTRLDFSRHIGGILSAADRAKLALTEASHTPQIANGILQLTGEAMADLLMPRSPRKGKIRS